MAAFDIGETVICKCEVTDEDGVKKDPTTSMKITITDQQGSIKVDDAAMIKDATGEYHYDCQTANYNKGLYSVVYTATDGSRITIEKEAFSLE
jgi:hypothetical protein